MGSFPAAEKQGHIAGFDPEGVFLRIPEQVGHQFRSNPATDSASFRPGIPVESGH
jgi:hypothetical protein